METEKSIELLKKRLSTLETLFSNEFFFTKFVEEQKVDTFFDLSFLQFKMVDLCYLFRHLICEISPLKLREEINLSKILQFLSTTIKNEIQVEYSIVLFKLISSSPKDRLFLNSHQNFFMFSNCIQSASSEIIIECFNELVFTSPVNFELFLNIILFYQKYPEHQNSLFRWIFNDVVINHSDMLHEINDVVPFFGWVTKITPVNELINSILTLSKYEMNFISPFISPLLSLLNKSKPNFEEFKTTIQIIEGQILLHKVSLSDLSNFDFLKIFVIDMEIDILGQLFERIYTFSQLVYDIFILPKSKLLRPNIIYILIQMCGKFPKTCQFFSIFFIVSNSKKNVSLIMRAIVENKNGELCVALGNSFVKSNAIIKYFLSEKGIEWLNNIFESKLIDLHQFIFMINSLTKNKYINEVDKYIESLPKSHPIFSIVQEDLITLSYGFENSNHLYPLKITSLFSYLKCPQKIDPYNAFMIGKYIFDKIENKQDIPILTHVVNRYINDDSFQKIIEIDPLKFELFCDPAFDHFPLFQVNEFFENNTFNVKYKGISFWFKFSEYLKKDQKVLFFTSGKLQLFVANFSIFVNYNGNEYDVPANTMKWNHIIISISSQKNSNYIYVYVNMNKNLFITSTLLFEMKNFEFSTLSSFLFIGPSIRIYQNDKMINDIEIISKNGPSFSNHLNESLIISPSTLKNYLQLNKNIFSVEYKGFPSHFLSQRKKQLFVNRITKSSIKEIEFIFAIKSCFKVYSILKGTFNNFIPFILMIYSKVPRFINDNILFETFNFFLNCRSKSEVINAIVAQDQFWSNVPADLIIIALFHSFYNLDFYKNKKQLEFFFSLKSFHSNGNPKMFKYLFYLKYSQDVLNKLFIASHFISSKQDKFTQCHLNYENNSYLNEVIIDQNNVSIQCNLNSNEKNYLSNFDSICLFQTIKLNEFQKYFAVFLNKMIIQTKDLNFIPLSSIYSLFFTSNTKMRIYLYSILLNCEKVAPGSIQFDSLFLCLIPPMFTSKLVWTESFNLLTSDSNEIKKPSILPVIFALLWGYTVASIQSIASTGSQVKIRNEIADIINVLSTEKNLKILSKKENIQSFMVSWFPYLLGVDLSNNDFHSIDEWITPQEIEFNDNMVTSTGIFSFLSMIWGNVVKEANLPIQTKSEYYINLQAFIVSSQVFKFYFNLTFSMLDSIFDNVIGAFYSIPIVSGKNEITNCFIGYFTHSLLNIITENLMQTMKVKLILPFIHFVCLFRHINEQYLPIIISDLLLLSSVIDIVNNEYFRNLAQSFSLLFINIFLSIIKIIKNKDNDNASFIYIIDSLYQNLYQQNHHFTKILKEVQIQKEFYLQFFYQTSRFCSNKDLYIKFIKNLGKSLSFDEDEQFQSLFKTNNDNIKIDIEKWNNFIVSQINQNRKNYLSLSYFAELPKSFTVVFLNELNKQKEIFESLQPIINETKNFEDSKKFCNYTIGD